MIRLAAALALFLALALPAQAQAPTYDAVCAKTTLKILRTVPDSWWTASYAATLLDVNCVGKGGDS